MDSGELIMKTALRLNKAKIRVYLILFRVKVKQILERTKKKTQNAVSKLKTAFSFLPVYFEVRSLDCDYVCSIIVVRYKNMREAVKKLEKIYEDAEGPVYVERVNKEYYESSRHSTKYHLA